MAKKPKSPSLAKVAKTYKKAHNQPFPSWNGASYVDSGMNKSSLGSGKSKLNYTPKPTAMTYGGTRKGKGTTIRKTGKAK